MWAWVGGMSYSRLVDYSVRETRDPWDATMASASVRDLVEVLIQSRLLQTAQLEELSVGPCARITDPRELAQEILRRGWLTPYQINQILQGKTDELQLGSYLLLERLGEGGMGQVFKARHKTLDRIVALKLIKKDNLDNPLALSRFQREIRAVAQLSHPNIVHAFDADQVEGNFFLAMEYVEGLDLAHLIKQEGPLEVPRACDYVRQAALGLQHAHERGFVHRDIKPANLLVTKPNPKGRGGSAFLVRPGTGPSRWGLVKVLDLGLARCHGPDPNQASTHLTQLGSLMGTPEFIAPEQVRNSHTSDIRADLYSLGCTLYFLLAGRPPFHQGTVMEKLLAHQTDTAPPVEEVRRSRLIARFSGENWSDAFAEVPTEVVELLRLLMAKRPEDRLQHPAELVAHLEGLSNQFGWLDPLSPVKPSGTVARPVSANTRSASKPIPMAKIRAKLAEPIAMVTAISLPGPEKVMDSEAALTEPVQPPASLKRTPRRRAALWATGAGFGLLVLIPLLAGTQRPKASPIAHLPAILDPETAGKAWKILATRSAEATEDPETIRKDLLTFRMKYPGSPEAYQATLRLTQMPSPLDKLDPNNLPIKDKMLGGPLDLVAMFGDLKGAPGRRGAAVAAFSPDGRHLAGGCDDNLVRLWDAYLPRTPSRLVGHTARVLALAFAPDGNTLASGSEDGTARIWDPKREKEIHVLSGHGQGVRTLAYSPDGQTLASAGADGLVKIWNLANGLEIRSLDGLGGPLRAMVFSPDGRFLFWGGDGQVIRWIDVSKPNSRPDVAYRLEGPVFVLAFHPEGKTLVCGGALGLLRLANWDGMALREHHAASASAARILDLAFSPAGRSFVTLDDERTVRRWDSATGQKLRDWTNRWPVFSLTFAPDGRYLALVGANGLISLYRVVPASS